MANGGVRAIHPGVGAEGLAKADLLDRFGGHADAAGFRALFAEGQFSFAIQGLELHVPALASACARLATLFGYRFDVTAFLSPPRTVATRPHYDRSEVFALQLHGQKRWDLFEPVDRLPAHRARQRTVDVDAAVPRATKHLTPGDLLYVPRGVIHRVVNEDAAPSLHLSFVGLVDSWASVFGNAMEAAYAALMDSPEWRAAVRCREMAGDIPEMRLRQMIASFSSHMLATISLGTAGYLDHCINDDAQVQRLAAARKSIDLLDGPGSGLVVRLSGAHFLERYGDAYTTNVSTDGDRFYPVASTLLEALRGGPRPLEELVSRTSCSDEEFLRSMTVLIRDTGAASLDMATMDSA
nr:cupin domain-containing protein [Luteibacter yeojuensis]